MSQGDLIQFIENCSAISMIFAAAGNFQVPLWPTSNIQAGEIGMLLKSQYYNEMGTLCEVLIGQEIFFDVPRVKFEKLPAPAME